MRPGCKMKPRKGSHMRISLPAMACFCVTSVAVWAAESKPAAQEADPQLARQISRAVGKLNDDKAAERDAAEKKLLELAGTSPSAADHFLQTLPKETDQMP